MPKPYDTIILGGGVVGASAAEVLARRGQHVLLLEQFEPTHQRGSSHGDGRIIRHDYGEPIYVEMVRLAYAAWAEVAARAGEPLLQRTGGWNCGPSDSPHLAELEINFKQLGIAYERLLAEESNRRFPHFHLDSGSEAIYQPEGSILFADKAVLALWRLAQTAGAETRTRVRVTAIAVENNLVQVRDQSGKIWQGRGLILAAGSWSGLLARDLGLDLPLTVTQEQLAYFTPNPKANVDHCVGTMPFCLDYHTTQPFYSLPQVEISGVKAGWHHTGKTINPDDPQPIDPQNLTAVQEFIRRRYPHLSTEPFQVQRCLYTNTPDFHFILDHHPNLPQVVIAAGFSGHGFKFGPVLGQILAALLLDETPPVKLDQFALRRFAQPEPLKPRLTA